MESFKEQRIAALGGTETPEDRDLALEIVNHELVEEYKDCPDEFFNNKEDLLSGIENPEKLYKEILDKPEIQKLLATSVVEMSMQDLDEKILNQLRAIIRNEIRLSHNLLRPNYNGKRIEYDAGVRLTYEQEEYIMGRISSHLCRLIEPDLYYAFDGGVIKTAKSAIYADDKREVFLQKFVASDSVSPVETIHNQICESFGKAYVQFASTVQDPSGEGTGQIREIIGNESEDVIIFWSLAPYMYDELLRADISSHEAMGRILGWVKDSYPNDLGSHEPINMRRRLKFTDDIVWGNMFLGADQRMPSHLYARLCAKKIVENIL